MFIILKTNILLKQMIQTLCKIRKMATIAQLSTVCVMKNILTLVGSLSSRVEKFQAIYNKQIEKYGNCLTIVMGEYDGKQAAFLLQNMFPITEKYLDHIHTRNNNPVPVKYSIQTEISTKIKRILQLHARGKKIVFPDISKLEHLMLEEATSAE